MDPLMRVVPNTHLLVQTRFLILLIREMSDLTNRLIFRKLGLQAKPTAKDAPVGGDSCMEAKDDQRLVLATKFSMVLRAMSRRTSFAFFAKFLSRMRRKVSSWLGTSSLLM